MSSGYWLLSKFNPTLAIFPVVLFLFCLFPSATFAANYYVDSDTGNDSYTCTQAQNPTTPKKSIDGFNTGGANSILSCSFQPGDIVYFKGNFTNDLKLPSGWFPTINGQVLYQVTNIVSVKDSTVTFNQTASNLNPSTDYVTIYNSRKGNSGAFAVKSFSQTTVEVDTTDLPGGKFLSETAADPGDLQAAIIRPIRFTAWDQSNPPTYTGKNQALHIISHSVIMYDHWRSTAGISTTGGNVWPALKIDGTEGGHSDFIILSHNEVTNAESALAIESNHGNYTSNYDIIQHNNFHHTGAPGITGDDAIIYWGEVYKYNYHHDFAQFMYNRLGPHVSNASIGDGIDVKHSAHNITIFGNELVGINNNDCSDAPIKIGATNAFVANNYLHDMNPSSGYWGCGISVVDDDTNEADNELGYDDPNSGGENAIVANNIITNIFRIGIYVYNADNVKVLNNTIYNIPHEPDCSEPSENPQECPYNAGIHIRRWVPDTVSDTMDNVTIKNNLIQKVGKGIEIYEDASVNGIQSDYNLVFETTTPFKSLPKNTHDLITNPYLINPAGGNFALAANSPAISAGADLSALFTIDHQQLIRPIGNWDIGAYEFSSTITTPLIGDLNHDQKVDFRDLMLFLPYFNQTGTSLTADFNQDSKVNLFDFNLLITTL